MWLFIAFLLVPLIEIALFIQVGGWIGLWPTLLVVVLTAILGAATVRAQGAAALQAVGQSFNELRDPSEPLAHGAMILFAGALLLTPGFFTDACGFALLVPAVRTSIMRSLRGRVRVETFRGSRRDEAARGHAGMDVIDAEYRDLGDGADQAAPDTRDR